MVKPLTVQFRLRTKEELDALGQVVNKFSEETGNRSLRNAGVAKLILQRALNTGIAERLLEFHADDGSAMGTFERADSYQIPLLGTIAAGSPIPVLGSGMTIHDGEMLSITREILPEQEGLFALKVRGDSMTDALINDGDVVVLKKQETAENGEMVAVWLRDEKATTLKRLYKEKKKIRLQPANPLLKPRYEDPENVQVQGKVLLVIRQMQAGAISR